MYLPVGEHTHLVSFRVTTGEQFLEILDLSSVVCSWYAIVECYL